MPLSSLPPRHALDPHLPGDKSIALRAILLQAIAAEPSRISGLPTSGDVQAALRAALALGAQVDDEGDGTWRLTPQALPTQVDVDVGGSQTLLRLLAGLCAGLRLPLVAHLNAQLAQRPQQSLIDVLGAFGARATQRGATFTLAAAAALTAPGTLQLTSTSAQLKGAALLAAIAARQKLTLIEPTPTRVHTEAYLAESGVTVRSVTSPHGHTVFVDAKTELPGRTVHIPKDMSSAAFFFAIAGGAAGNVCRVDDVSLAGGRVGFIDMLARMGAHVTRTPMRSCAGDVGRIEVVGDALTAVSMAQDAVAGLVDEVPILACVAAQARGTTTLSGLGSLRHKESDRVRSTAALLRAFDVDVRVADDALIIRGGGVSPADVVVETAGDHRIAMAALCLARMRGVSAQLDDAGCVDKSFPGFAKALADW